jgi:cytochrome c oxidase subunit II
MHFSVFDPASPQASELLWLWDVCMWVCGFLLAVVSGSILYILFRFRQSRTREASQIAGNRKLEITWTAIPIALVAFLFAVSVMAAREVDRPIEREPDLIVTGHQWWWEVRYPSAGVITANEVHVPVGRDMLVAVEAADVIHDFWAPRLARKVDAIPGRRTFVWIRAERAGDYLGACAEFCGAQHAWMRFRVVAQEPAAYEAWLDAQAKPAADPATAEAQHGEQRFKDLTCVNCHTVRGVNSQNEDAPDLTHVAGRKMLAGERLPNTRENLRDWLHEPNILKPNCYMPNLKLSARDLASVTAYLETLR